MHFFPHTVPMRKIPLAGGGVGGEGVLIHPLGKMQERNILLDVKIFLKKGYVQAEFTAACSSSTDKQLNAPCHHMAHQVPNAPPLIKHTLRKHRKPVLTVSKSTFSKNLWNRTLN